MSDALRIPMSQQEFFHWAERQEERYEFDGFAPVEMTGGTLGHSVVTASLNRHLATRLAGRRGTSMGSDAGVGTVGGGVRYPDAVVTCSEFNNSDRLVPEPVIVFEVVSPSSIRIDRVIKLREYQAIPSIRRYIIVEMTTMAVTVFTRDAGRGPFKAIGLSDGDTLDLPEIDIELPIAEIYETIRFDIIQDETERR